jgi:hypothetical protein
VKKSWFSAPFNPVLSPNPIPQSWSMLIGLLSVSFNTPTNWPVIALKALTVPLLVLFDTSSVLLNGPTFFGAMAKPQG